MQQHLSADMPNEYKKVTKCIAGKLKKNQLKNDWNKQKFEKKYNALSQKYGALRTKYHQCNHDCAIVLNKYRPGFSGKELEKVRKTTKECQQACVKEYKRWDLIFDNLRDLIADALK